MMTNQGILEQLCIDPGQCTLHQLLQDREAALYEIRRLRAELKRRSIPLTVAKINKQPQVTKLETRAHY